MTRFPPAAAHSSSVRLKARALIFNALIPAILLGLTVAWGVQRNNLTLRLEKESEGGTVARFTASPKDAGPAGLRFLYLRIRAGLEEGAGGDVILNGSRIGAAGPLGREAKDALLEVPHGAIRDGDNVLVIRSGARVLNVENARLRNYCGQSQDIIKYILIPRDGERPPGWSWILAAAIFVVLFLLTKVRPEERRSRLLDWIDTACRIAVFLLLLGAAALPFLSRYRLLYSPKSLPLFLVLLSVSPLVVLLRKLIPRLRSDFSPEALQKAPGKRLLVAVVLPAIIMLFFASYMSAVKRYFGGNYSRFLRIDGPRLEEFRRLFWAPLVFENSDFEEGTLRNWHIHGAVFQDQPVARQAPQKSESRPGLEGQGRYGVESPGARDGADGRLVSVPFVVRHGTMRFLFGGEKAGVALDVEGAFVLSAPRGGEAGRMCLRSWDVRPWMGRTARLHIFFNGAPGEPAGPVSVDWFHYDLDQGLSSSLAPLDAYDGQYNYFMAYDPFLSRFRDRPKTYESYIDEPAYRYGRIGLALLSVAASLGNPRLYPMVMVWLIVLSHFAGAFFFLRILLFLGRHPLWALTYLLVPGFYYSLHVGLPESLCLALCLAALWAYLRGRLVPAALAAAAALFFRETGAILIVAMAADALFRKRRVKQAALLAAALAPYLLWKGFITWRLFQVNGWKSLTIGPSDFAFPFAGFAELLKQIVRGGYPRPAAPTAAAYVLLLTVLFIVALFLAVKKRSVLALAFGLYALLAVSLNYQMVWVGPLNGIRLTSEAFLFGFLAVLAGGRPQKAGWRIALAAWCLAVFLFNFAVANLSSFFRSAFVLW